MAAPTRVVTVGAGYFAAFHHAGWAEHPDANLAAIVDHDLAKAKAAGEKVGGPAVFASLTEALTSVEADLVDIAAPPPAHLELIDEATAAGLPVICQKPFCGGIEGARKAVALAAERDATVVVHENFRFQPWWLQAKAALDAGRLGQVYDIAFRLRPGDGQGPDAYLARQPYFQDMPRFLVHETAVHMLDVFRFLLGEPDWVWADLRRLNPVIKGEDAGVIVLGFKDGVRAVFDGNRLNDHVAENRRLVMGEAWLAGSAATLAIDGDGGMTIRAHGENEATALPLAFSREKFAGGCVDALQAHVLAHLRDGTPLQNTASDYLRNLELVEAVYRSAATGDRVLL